MSVRKRSGRKCSAWSSRWALGLDYERIARQPFNKLSGGQKQKLLISMALGRPTELLVMDEPAANLDPDARHVLFKALAERAGPGRHDHFQSPPG